MRSKDKKIIVFDKASELYNVLLETYFDQYGDSNVVVATEPKTFHFSWQEFDAWTWLYHKA